MLCSACGHENRASAKFCEECAAPLQLRCSNCGTELRPAAKFCDECATPASTSKAAAAPTPDSRVPLDYTPRHLADRILQSKSALEGERKQVTVLFADVKQSTELAELLDAEEWHRILERFFEILSEGVHRFEGTVNQYTGDGIMALFGAPLAHEDHAQRACWAALHLQSALQNYTRDVKREHEVDFAVRFGLNSGEVVVGKIGDDLRMDYTAQGTVVHLAARMQQLAEAGKVYVSPATAQLAEGYFAFEDLGDFRVRGVSEPVRIRELCGTGAHRTRFDVSRSRGLVRFVGRQSEMQMLDAALESAREGNGQVVGVVAEAGTGKSRLCFEFIERCRARGLAVREGHCVAHGKNLPLVPILEVVRAYYGIADDDDARTAREKVAGRMLLLDEAFRVVLPVIFELLGVADPTQPASQLAPEARQRQLFGVVRRLLREAVEPGREPSVLLLEDLHWIDGSSESWLEEFVDATAGTPNLLLVNFRPEYHASWMQRAHYQQLALTPLGPDAIRDLLGDLIGSDPSTTGLAETVYQRTGGNPFFAEELIQSLIESGQLEGSRGSYRLGTPIEHLDVPRTVQALLAARIDRLAEREKRVLQRAAVIGKEFEEPLLEAVAELLAVDLTAALATLRAAEFVYERALYPVAEYSFKHPLTQEVALDSLLRERRRSLHAAVARALEARSDKLDEQAALLAHHWEEAGEEVTASRWHLRAAEWMGLKDLEQTAHHARAVLTLLRDQETQEGATSLLAQAAARLVSLGWRLGMEEDAAERLYQDARRWAQAAGDVATEARICGSYAAVLCVAGQIEDAWRIGDEFLALCEQTGDPALRLVGQGWMAYPTNLMGQLEEAERRILSVVRAVESGEQPEDLGVQFLGASLMGFVLQWRIDIQARTQPAERLAAAFERAVRWTRDRREKESEANALATYARSLATYVGETGRALAAARQALVIADELGSSHSRINAMQAIAACLVVDGSFAEASDLSARAIEEMRAHRVAVDREPMFLAVHALGRLGCGDADGALALAREGVASSERSGARIHRFDALVAAARAETALGRLDDAERSLDRAEALAREMGAINLQPLVFWRRADVAAGRGDTEGRAMWLSRAESGFRAIGAVPHAERVAREMAS